MKQRKPPKSAAVHFEPAAALEKTISHHAYELIATVLGAIENAATHEEVPRREEAGSRSKQASEKRARAQSA